jgi:hypothetical protein
VTVVDVIDADDVVLGDVAPGRAPRTGDGRELPRFADNWVGSRWRRGNWLRSNRPGDALIRTDAGGAE